MRQGDSGERTREVLADACRTFAAGRPRLSSWRVEADRQHLVIALEIDGLPLRLLVGPRANGRSWAETPSLALSIQADRPISAIDREVELLARELVEVIRGRDDGTLPLPSPPRHATGRPDRAGVTGLGRHLPAARRAHERLREELHFASFMAWKGASTEDLYPHISPLGVLVPEEELLGGWRDAARRIRDGRAPEKLGLYVHVPFCGVACTFCYCAKTDNFKRDDVDAYVDELLAAIALHRPIFDGLTFTSVYFGGGTPSMLSPSAMERLFTALYQAFHVPPATQMVFEGNPDSLNDRKIEILAKLGRVTRLTIGVQTLDPEAQRRAKRFNKPEHVAAAVDSARRWGIPHVNLDFMAGLDGQSFEAFQKDVRFAVGLQPDSLHLNGFRPMPHTGFAQAGSELTRQQLELRDRMLAWGNTVLEDTGFHLGLEGSRTANAVNIQEYDFRRQNSSLLGLGYPARSHSFANHYYLPDLNAGIDLGLSKHLKRRARLRAVRVDEHEEAHKYLAENIRTGFVLDEFRRLFRREPGDVAPDAWRMLSDLGVVASDGTHVHTDPGHIAQAQTYRWFLYSPKLQARAREVWGREYDAKRDYAALLDVLLEAPGARADVTRR